MDLFLRGSGRVTGFLGAEVLFRQARIALTSSGSPSLRPPPKPTLTLLSLNQRGPNSQPGFQRIGLQRNVQPAALFVRIAVRL